MIFKLAWELLKETFSEWQEDRAARLAAALAYYTVFSLAPLLIIALGIAGLALDPDTAGRYLTGQVRGLIGNEGAGVIQRIVQNASQPASSIRATLIGLGTLLFGAMGVFNQLQDALNTVWEVTPKPGQGFIDFVKARLLSFMMVLAIGFLLLVSLIVSSVLTALNNYVADLIPVNLVFGRNLEFVVSFGFITLFFAMIYKILPDAEVSWGDVGVGAAATAFLFGVGKFLLALYLGGQSFGSTYGAAGSILILLLWVYYSAQIFLFGAEFTQVYARRFGSRIVPATEAVRVTSASQLQPATSYEPRSLLAPAFNQGVEPKPDRFTAILLGLLVIGLIIGAMRK